MPATTPTYGFPYQELTDPPNGPVLGQDLAEAVEGELSRIDTSAASTSADVATLQADVAELKPDVATLQADVAELQADVAELQATPDAAAAASGSITLEPGNYLVQGAVGVTNGSTATDLTIRLDVLAGAATGTGNGSTVGAFSSGKENIADFWMVTVTTTATLQLAVAGLSAGGVVHRQHLAAFTR